MVKLIVGLGNPGRQYEKTRHNAGFLFLDGLAEDRGVAWSLEKRFQGAVTHFMYSGSKVWLLKPETFMNRSGQAVRRLTDFYKIKSEEILVVHDELDFIPGIVKLKNAGGHAGHNGLRDIISHLGTNAFWRIRIGIGRPQKEGLSVADYVLSNMAISEEVKVQEALGRVYSAMNLLIDGNTEKFSSQVH